MFILTLRHGYVNTAHGTISDRGPHQPRAIRRCQDVCQDAPFPRSLARPVSDITASQRSLGKPHNKRVIFFPSQSLKGSHKAKQCFPASSASPVGKHGWTHKAWRLLTQCSKWNVTCYLARKVSGDLSHPMGSWRKQTKGVRKTCPVDLQRLLGVKGRSDHKFVSCFTNLWSWWLIKNFPRDKSVAHL